MPDKHQNLLLCLFGRLGQNSKPRSSRRRMRKLMGSPLLFIVLSFLYPAVYLLELNSHIYTTDQIIVTLIFVFLMSVITASVGGIFVSYLVKVSLLVAKKIGLKTDLISVSSKLYRALLGGFGTFILLVLLHSAIRELIPVLRSASWAVLYLLVSLGLSILTFRHQINLFNFILCVLIAVNCALGIVHSFRSESLNFDAPKKQLNVVFKQKPNVYLMILESYASLDIRKEIYDIDNGPFIRELNEKNYDIYKIYSCYGDTLSSVASIFLMDHHYYKLSRGLADGGGYRKIIGGVRDNRVINILLNNGYRIDYNKFPSSLFHPSSVVNTQEIQPLLQPIEVFGGLFIFSKRILNYSLWTTKFFQSLLWLPEKIRGKLPKPVENDKTENDERPVFTVSYAGATHTAASFFDYPPEIGGLPGAHQMPLWKLNRADNYWISNYKNNVAKSDAALIESIAILPAKTTAAAVATLKAVVIWSLKPCNLPVKPETSASPAFRDFLRLSTSAKIESLSVRDPCATMSPLLQNLAKCILPFRN